ncbi:Mechanosensitive ion channel family protein [Caenorhabditis elegans]|uniref:Mechanosensitive ion channel family protein n=1 Tax=Caenorhabditis elegans TaxID=6239 RepID=A4UVL7_CAEEL|nr:Mechanosensitive ion channel family protein [Caenorhabditis elegans]CAM84811.1 Mechanosensitive ion channel family protein [Caenorhabditis elegans]|eukprot:NP_001123003.1 Uncharacterized protein CELE_T05E12.8 [Caenorhabditis elegans]
MLTVPFEDFATSSSFTSAAIQIIILLIIMCSLTHTVYAIGRALIPSVATLIRRMRSRRYYFNTYIARSLDR